VRGLKKLNIRGLVHVGEVSDFNVKKKEDLVKLMQEQYAPEDRIRALVTSVDVVSGRISLSFRSSRISAASSGIRDRLGTVSDKDDSASDDEEDSPGAEQRILSAAGKKGAYWELIKKDSAFHNPYGMNAMAEWFGVNSNVEHDGLCTRYRCSEKEGYEVLRVEQNQVWARAGVLKGISQMKEGLYEKAMASYDHALEVRLPLSLRFALILCILVSGGPSEC